jgi:hypothetical protein
VNLSDLFLLFIYAEVLGMVGAFYKSHRIPITLPMVIPPFLVGLRSRRYAAMASRCFGVIPPKAMFGRS